MREIARQRQPLGMQAVHLPIAGDELPPALSHACLLTSISPTLSPDHTPRRDLALIPPTTWRPAAATLSPPRLPAQTATRPFRPALALATPGIGLLVDFGSPDGAIGL